MSRTFNDLYGKLHNLDYLMKEFNVSVDCHTDIVTEEVTGYVVLLDGEERYKIDEDVYEALKEIL